MCHILGMQPPPDSRIAFALMASRHFEDVAKGYVVGEESLRSFQRDAQSLANALAVMGIRPTR